MRASVLQSRMVHSEKLSKSKPFGILRFAQFRITLPFNARSRHQQQEEQLMFTRLIQLGSAFLFASVLTASSPGLAGDDGIVTVKSAYSIRETIEHLKKDIADKGIKFFNEIDQSKLAVDAGIELRPSVLLIFGNPPLGTQFITANANAGLDWPVRLLVYENDKGEVWTGHRRSLGCGLTEETTTCSIASPAAQASADTCCLPALLPDRRCLAYQPRLPAVVLLVK
jgi:uncharacterized protein (DUF302 family)